MTKRKKISVIIVLMLSCMLCACRVPDENLKETSKQATVSETIQETEDENQIPTLKFIKSEAVQGTDIRQFFFYDPETYVMFTAFSASHSPMNVMYLDNADGTHRVYIPPEEKTE